MLYCSVHYICMYSVKIKKKLLFGKGLTLFSILVQLYCSGHCFPGFFFFTSIPHNILSISLAAFQHDLP